MESTKKDLSFQNNNVVQKIIELNDGRLITFSSRDVKLWTSTGQLQKQLISYYQGMIIHHIMLPDQKLLTYTHQGNVSMFDLNVNKEIMTLSLPRGIVASKILPSYEVVMEYEKDKIALFNIYNGKFRSIKHNTRDLQSIHILPNNQVLLVFYDHIMIWV